MENFFLLFSHFKNKIFVHYRFLGHDILDGFKNKVNKNKKLMAGKLGISNIDIIQLFLNGLFEANGLAE